MWDIPDKVANNGVSLAGKHMHSEFNNRQHEIEKVVTSTGIALTAYPTDPNATSDTDETMLAQSISRLASLGTAAAGSGVANAFVLSALGAVVAPKALFDSMTVVTIPSATNTGASTANVFGLGVKAIRSYSDTALTGGEIVSGRPTAWRYSTAANSGAGAWLILPWAIPLSLQMRSYSPPLLTGTFSFSAADSVTSNISSAAVGLNSLVDTTFTAGGLMTCGTLDAGVWQVAMRAGTATAGDEILAQITSNVGSNFAVASVKTSGGGPIANASGILRLAAGNTVQFQARQISGTTRTITGTFSATRIGA